MKRVVIMRGLPGSGKDAYIRNRFLTPSAVEPVVVCSADDFFVKGGEYRFDVSKLGEAHSTCYRAFLEALAGQYSIIIVNNTHIRRWEYANYEIVARLFKVPVEIIEMRVETIAEAFLCAKRNVHGVPVEVVAKMALDFEPDDRATKVKIFSDSVNAGAIYPCKDEG
jgi:predicted kinase